ncbi:MAG: hypothetical protein R3E83_19040 [Burkholderiaceae bacterium]
MDRHQRPEQEHCDRGRYKSAEEAGVVAREANQRIMKMPDRQPARRDR